MEKEVINPDDYMNNISAIQTAAMQKIQGIDKKCQNVKHRPQKSGGGK